MPGQALFVDLPNFYSRLLASEIGDDRDLRDYVLQWFDFDRLSERLTGQYSPVWVFYSGRRFGPSGNRIQDQYLDDFVGRINLLPGVTAWDVNIPGQQREPATYECEQCGHKGIAQWESEKGIDASLTVHLFDTMDTWDAAFLLSGDADFVPAVQSLRRRGKIVVGAGFATPSSALVRECYDYIDLASEFVRDDFVAFAILREGGLLDTWVRSPVRARLAEGESTEPIELSFEWQQTRPDPQMETVRSATLNEVVDRDSPHYIIYLNYSGGLDLTERDAAIRDFREQYPEYVNNEPMAGHCKLTISPVAWQGLARRLDEKLVSFTGLQEWDSRGYGHGYTVHYRYNDELERYEINERPRTEPS